MELFRGYVVVKGNGDKGSLTPYKDNAPLFTLEQVQHLHSYGGVIEDNFVLVDFDIEGEGEKMLQIVNDLDIKCRAYKTTKGFHFYFQNQGRIKKNATRENVACGLRPDFKVGGRNSYAVLKLDGVDRELIYDVEGDYDVIPSFLLPVKKHDVNFMELKEGDGRNSELFKHILRLLNAGISKDESKDIIRLMNRYVLKKPLDENELNVIIRDDAFPEIESTFSFFDKSGFRHDEFGDYLIEKYKMVKINGQTHMYKDGVYVGHDEIEKVIVENCKKLKSSQRNEVMKYIDLKTQSKLVSDARYIPFKNGIYNIETDELLNFSPDVVVTNQIPWDYNPSAYSELADSVLNNIACNDEEVRSLLEECMGYCFFRMNQLGKSFFLTGGGANGKSTFINMIRDLLGEGNTSSLDIAELNEKFSIAGLSGKLANMGDDISDEFLQGRAVATFKKIVTGDKIKAEYKGENPFEFSPYAKMIFSANEIPRVRDKTGAVLRRMVIIPFNAVFTKENQGDKFRPYIAEELRSREVMEYLARIGIEGLKRVNENRRFTESSKVKVALKEYENDNNPILSFLEDTEIENQPIGNVFAKYFDFCRENGYMSLTKNNFAKEVKRLKGYTSSKSWIDGKTHTIFIKNG